jgi:hypothetical protein
MANIPQTPEVPYRYYELVTNVIRAVKIKCFVIPVVYRLIYHDCQPIRIQGSNQFKILNMT